MKEKKRKFMSSKRNMKQNFFPLSWNWMKRKKKKFKEKYFILSGFFKSLMGCCLSFVWMDLIKTFVPFELNILF